MLRVTVQTKSTNLVPSLKPETVAVAQLLSDKLTEVSVQLQTPTQFLPEGNPPFNCAVSVQLKSKRAEKIAMYFMSKFCRNLRVKLTMPQTNYLKR